MGRLGCAGHGRGWRLLEAPLNSMRNSMNSGPRSWEEKFLLVWDEQLQKFPEALVNGMRMGKMLFGVPWANDISFSETGVSRYENSPSVQPRAGAYRQRTVTITMAMIQVVN